MAREAADAAGLPIMVHPQRSWAASFDEIITSCARGTCSHMYHGEEHGILDEAVGWRPSVRAARERGVVFDVGHGERFVRLGCRESARAGLSTDDHFLRPPSLQHQGTGASISRRRSQSSSTSESSLEDALAMVTAVPARVVGMEGEIGTLAVVRRAMRSSSIWKRALQHSSIPPRGPYGGTAAGSYCRREGRSPLLAFRDGGDDSLGRGNRAPSWAPDARGAPRASVARLRADTFRPHPGGSLPRCIASARHPCTSQPS